MINFFVLLISALLSAVFIYYTEAAGSPPPRIPQANQVWKDTVSGLEFVWLPGGCFQLGSRDPSQTRLFHEKPMHKVCLDGFWMGRYEVTNAQYRQYKPEHSSRETGGHSLDGDKQPVVHVSWHNAKEYTDWLNNKREKKTYTFRLPTEAEWEYACRAGTDTERYWNGQEGPAATCRYVNVADIFYQIKRVHYHNCSDGFFVSAPVGSFPANPAGLYDMLGNVWEWCEDRYGRRAYRRHETQNPLYRIVEDGMDYRVIRGGSWLSEPSSIRCAKRSPSPPISRYNTLGFRVVIESEQDRGASTD